MKEEFCANIQNFHAVGHASVFTLILAVVQIGTSVAILIFIEYASQKRAALQSAIQRTTQGEAIVINQNETLVLPMYFVLLWGMVIADLYQGIITVFWPRHTNQSDSITAAIAQAVGYGMFHMVLEGAAIFMCGQGAGIRSVKKSCLIGGAWGVFTGGLWFSSFYSTNRLCVFSSRIVWQVMLFSFYSVLWFAPAHRLFRRPSVLAYAGFFAFKYGLDMVGDVFQMLSYDVGLCVAVSSSVLLWGFARPLVFTRMLQLDSYYWQGCFPGTTGPSSYWSNLIGRFSAVRDSRSKVPLLGFAVARHAPQLEPQSAREIAYQIDSVLSGETTKHESTSTNATTTTATRSSNSANAQSANSSVRLINFARLSLGTGTVLGAGGTAKVYLGELDGTTPVAVKMLYPMDLTIEKVERFVFECQLLARLHHPNIIEVKGFCVVPPSICICLELAARGALFNELQSNHPSYTWDRRYGMAIDCVRAVTHLHRQQPPVLHNDLKSLNFFVMADGTIKLGDFDFCSFAQVVRAAAALAQPMRQQTKKNIPPPSPNYGSLVAAAQQKKNAGGTWEEFGGECANASGGSGAGIPHTVNWLAPEVVRDGAFSPASDVYSLGMVLWEIASGRVPFEETMFPTNEVVRDAILRGVRPEIDPEWPAPFCSLITQCWSENPQYRPSADEVYSILVSLSAASRAMPIAPPDSGLNRRSHHSAPQTNARYDSSNNSGSPRDALPSPVRTVPLPPLPQRPPSSPVDEQ